jgi:hypothetical protein
MSKWQMNWKGDDVARNILRYSVTALNDTGGECVRTAKSNHSGWQNRTGLAEGSIQVQQPAAHGSITPSMEWGSRAVKYFRRLEFEHGSALRSAAQVVYPTLPERIRRLVK